MLAGCYEDNGVCQCAVCVHLRQTIKSSSRGEYMHNAAPLKSNWRLVQDGSGYACTSPCAIMRFVNLATGLLCFLKKPLELHEESRR